MRLVEDDDRILMNAVRFSSLITAAVIFKNASEPEDWKKPGQNQRDAENRFPALVKTSRLHLYEPDEEEIPKPGKRFLIGAASYSLIEMYILDALNEWLKSGQNVAIDVFDLSSCTSTYELAKYLPNVRVPASPVVQEWCDGELVKTLVGGSANKYLKDYFQLDPILENLMEKENRIGREIGRLLKEGRTGFVER